MHWIYLHPSFAALSPAGQKRIWKEIRSLVRQDDCVLYGFRLHLDDLDIPPPLRVKERHESWLSPWRYRLDSKVFWRDQLAQTADAHHLVCRRLTYRLLRRWQPHPGGPLLWWNPRKFQR